MKRVFVTAILALAAAGAALAQEAQPAAAPALSLPTGTGIKMKLETPLSTRSSKPGDTFAGRVTEAVLLNGKAVIPVGAAVQGRVVRVTDPRRIKGVPTLDLMPDQITMPDGARYTITAVVVDTNAAHTGVNDEGEIKGPGHDTRDLLEMGVGTGAGVGVGAAVGGGKGALIGGLIGGGATVIHWLTRRHSADLPAGTEIVMELNRPLAMSPATATGQ
ncbi:MAG TPA: hypothetical protein VMK66_13505 [Myxococcales bacterium]|nr:hypothetical protein [Myxococcales bacterium]